MSATRPLTYAEVAAKPATALIEASHVYNVHPTWRAHSTPGPTFHCPLNGAGPPGRIFQARDWRPPRDCHFGPPKAPSGADSCDVGPFPGPRTASGRLSGVQTLTHASTWNRFSWHACHVFCAPKLMEASVRVRGGEAYLPTAAGRYFGAVLCLCRLTAFPSLCHHTARNVQYLCCEGNSSKADSEDSGWQGGG